MVGKGGKGARLDGGRRGRPRTAWGRVLGWMSFVGLGAGTWYGVRSLGISAREGDGCMEAWVCGLVVVMMVVGR